MKIQHTLQSITVFTMMLFASIQIAWAQDTTWDGTDYSTTGALKFTDNNFVKEGLADTDHDGKSWEKAFVITTARQLAYFAWIVKANKTGRTNAYYWKLGADIDLNGTNYAWIFGSNAGGAFQGHFDGQNHTISNIKLNVTANSNYGLLTTIQGESTSKLAEVKNLNISGVTFTSTGARTTGTKLGALAGTVKQANISNVQVSNVSFTYSNTSVVTGQGYFGGAIGYVDVVTTIKGVSVSGVSATLEENIKINSVNLGGLVGYAVGSTAGQTKILNNSVENVTIRLRGLVENASYVGGAIGQIGAYTIVDGMSVKGTNSITGPTTDKIVTNGKQFMVGGFIGMQNSSGSGDNQPNKFKNIAVSGMTINLAHYVPQSTISNHKFAVGGIAGTVNTPNQDSKGNRGMPENLISKGVKIYAPFAATSPTVANFNNSQATYSNYTGENVITVDAIERSKSGSWLYSDYQLGLSTSVLTGTLDYNATAAAGKVRRNFSAATTTDTNDSNLEWLAIDNTTFLRKNRYLDNERESWTVLWWTRSDNNASYANNNIEQNLYPQQNNADANKNPFKDSEWKYYMYFYQGVANAKYVDAAKADLIISGIDANVAQAVCTTPLTLSIKNAQEGQRGFAARTITVTPSSDDAVDSYKWYVDGVEQTGTTNSISVKPHWKLAKNIHVNAIKNSQVVASAAYALKVGVFKTKNEAGTDVEGMAIAERGTKINPYIIDSEEALRQLSYLSTVATGTFWEGLTKPVAPYVTNQSQGHYNRAYYELDADITMSSNPFVPISHMGYNSSASDGTYNTNWIFQGHFDGKGHKISGLKITWGAGQYNGNDAHVYHGLFGAVGGATAVAKWGEGSTTSPTVIKNLRIVNATLTHDTNNTSFYYNNGTSGNSNNCYVGVLAGIVSSNTTIQNVEISGSSITDAGSSYSLATKGLYVGGAIGSVQHAFSTTTTAPTAINIQHIAAQVDITLTNASFADNTAPAQVGLFNIGGIIGRYMATSASASAMQGIMPKYTLYSGTINAPNAWISPVLGALRYKDQNGGAFNNFSKQWEGNNNSAETQVTITNAQYYNFTIGSTPINNTTPANTCKLGFRTMEAHVNASEKQTNYQAAKYQGVNYNARYVAPNSTLELLNKERTEGYNFVWDNGGFVKMTTDTYVGLTLSRENATNNFTAVMEGAEPTSYTWQVSFDGEHWHNIEGVTEDTYTVPVSLKPKYVKASTTVNEKNYETLYDIVDADKELCNPQITKTVNGDNSEFAFSLNQKTADPMAALTTTYQWYQKKDTPISTATENQKLTLANTTLASDTYKNVVFCNVTVREFGEIVATYFLVNGATVVYINANNYGNDYPEGDDTNDGLTPQTPVKTLDHAYELLKTEADGGTVDNNIIVIMGVVNDGNSFKFQSDSEKPATLTGKYDGVDYKGMIKLDQIDPSGSEHNANPIGQTDKKGSNCYVLGDTQFQNLIFYGNMKGNCFIELHGRDAIFGEGLVMQNFANLSDNHGNMNKAETIPEFTIILYATNLTEAKIKEYTQRIHDTRKKPQTVTFKSGHYGRLMGGRFTQKFFRDYTNNAGDSWKDNTAYSILGSAEYPVWAEVNVEIVEDNEMTNGLTGTEKVTYSRDVNAIIAGLTDGSMYGDYTINFRGGNVAYIVGANQGNPVHNGKKTYTPLNGTSGNWGEWPNASYYGRTVINVDQKDGIKPITVGNLYAGGLGRKIQSGDASATVDMYVYGRTEVNVKKGTISGSVYGGGVGGVLGVNPWDAHVPYATTAADDKEKAIINKVQYGDTRFSSSWGSTMTTASDMAKVRMHNLKEDGSGYDVDYLDLKSTSTTVNVSGGTVNGNVYGGGYGFVQDMPNNATMQGVGSVFGTTNVNITGGTINGNIYGGSQGHTEYYNLQNIYGQTINHIAEMNGTVNLKITGTEDKCPVIKGDIYGAGQGIPSSNTEGYLRIATTGNVELAGNEATEEQKAKYKSTINITIDIPDSKAIEGNIFGGGRMGAVDGDINVSILSGQINGNVYGGGRGEKGHLQKARVNGTTNVTIGK